MQTTFKTELYITKFQNKEKTLHSLWTALRNWRCSSGNTPNDIKQWLCSCNEIPLQSRKDSKNISLEIKSAEKDKVGYLWGFHLTEKVKNEVWHTFIVYANNKNKQTITFETKVEGKSSREIPYSKPKFFEKEYIGQLLSLSTEPNFINLDTDSKLPSEIISGKKEIELPIIYMSKNNKTEQPYPVAPQYLAQKFYCMAFVFAEGDKRPVVNNIPKNGNIGIYWGNGEHYIFSPKGTDKTEIEKFLYKKIISMLSLKSFKIGKTWDDIERIEYENKNESLEKKIKELSANGENAESVYKEQTENYKNQIISLKNQLEEKDQEKKKFEDDYARNFDDEIKEKEEKIRQLSEENQKLEGRVQQLENKKSVSGSAITIDIPTTEKELFPNEIEDYLKGLIYNALKERDSKINADYKREKNVLKSILDKISDWEFDNSDSAKVYKECKDIVEKKDSIEKIKQGLERNGFQISSDKGHSKLHWQGDSHYSITLPSTPSDKRGNKNLSSDMNKSCFLCLK